MNFLSRIKQLGGLRRFLIIDKTCSVRGFTLWFTGLPGAGKSTLSSAVHQALLNRSITNVELLDSEVMRRCLSPELGFTKEDRELNIWRIGWIAKLLNKHGIHVAVAAISPYRATRTQIRKMLGETFIEVFVSCPIEECERRDPKGLYKKARKGLISQFTGIDDPYELPEHPEIIIETNRVSVQEGVRQVLTYLERRQFISSSVVGERATPESEVVVAR